MKHLLYLLLLFGITISQPVNALSYYIDISATRQSISTSIVTAKPYMSRIKLGFDYSQTVAVELIYGGSLQNDTIEGIIVDVEEMTGAYLRYNTNFHNKVRMYLFAGKSEITLSDFGQPEKTLSDTSLGIGFEEIAPWENTLYVLEYASYIKDGGNTVTGITIGLKFNM
jgi:hypothetical protein